MIINGSDNNPKLPVHYYPKANLKEKIEPPSKMPAEREPLGESIKEVGQDKYITQHVGNAAFGAASAMALFSTFDELARLGAKSRIARFIPGLNLFASSVEGLNATRKLIEGDTVVAAVHSGNALGCLASFLENSGMTARTAGILGKMGAGLAVGLSVVGGALGIAAGAAEIKKGLKIREAGGSNRTLTMGILDMTSGISSITAAVLMGTGVGVPAGIGLLIVAGICDLAGIAVDYLGHKFL